MKLLELCSMAQLVHKQSVKAHGPLVFLVLFNSVGSQPPLYMLYLGLAATNFHEAPPGGFHIGNRTSLGYNTCRVRFSVSSDFALNFAKKKNV